MHSAKERIFAAQTAEDCLVLNADNARAAEAATRSAATGLLVLRRASGRAGRMAGAGLGRLSRRSRTRPRKR